MLHAESGCNSSLRYGNCKWATKQVCLICNLLDTHCRLVLEWLQTETHRDYCYPCVHAPSVNKTGSKNQGL